MTAIGRLTAFCALGMLDACGEPPSPEPTTAANKPGEPADTLVVGLPYDADVLLRVVSQSAQDSALITQLSYDPLGEDFDCGIQVRPGLWKSWQWSEDGRTLSVALRDDVAWSDGVPVTAGDIAFTYELIADPSVASPLTSHLARLEPAARPRVVDDTHLEWRFTEAYDQTTQLVHVSQPATPRHVLKGVDRATLRGSAFATNPVTNGRWKLAGWNRGEKIVLEPSEAWSGPPEERPRLQRVVFRVLPEYATRLVDLELGDIDMMTGVQIADVDRLATEHPEIRLMRRGWRAMDYVGWNPLDVSDLQAKSAGLPDGTLPDLSTVKRHPFLGDRAVRRALAKAVDVDKLISDLLTSKATGERYGMRATGVITPSLCGIASNGVTPMPYDPKAAADELTALGWVDSNGDGTRDRDGVEMRFELLTSSGNPRRADGAVILQSQLHDVGVDMRISMLETNQFFERLRVRDFEAALAGWAAAMMVDPRPIWHGEDQHEFNSVSYDNPEVDALIERGLATPLTEQSAPIWTEMERLVYEDQPYLFLYWWDEIVAVDSRFQDVTVDELGALRDLHRVWVPPDKVKYQR